MSGFDLNRVISCDGHISRYICSSAHKYKARELTLLLSLWCRVDPFGDGHSLNLCFLLLVLLRFSPCWLGGNTSSSLLGFPLGSFGSFLGLTSVTAAAFQCAEATYLRSLRSCPLLLRPRLQQLLLACPRFWEREQRALTRQRESRSWDRLTSCLYVSS